MNTQTNPTPSVDPKSVGASAVRYLVPTLVGILVSLAAKAGFSLSATDAYGIVAPAVATAYSALAHYLEVKFPALSRVLGAQKPASMTK